MKDCILRGLPQPVNTHDKNWLKMSRPNLTTMWVSPLTRFAVELLCSHSPSCGRAPWLGLELVLPLLCLLFWRNHIRLLLATQRYFLINSHHDTTQIRKISCLYCIVLLILDSGFWFSNVFFCIVVVRVASVSASIQFMVAEIIEFIIYLIILTIS